MALLNNSVLMSSTPEILESFGEPIERAGMLIAAGTVTGIVAAPAIGFLADRYGRKRILVPCLLVFGTFGSLGGFSPSLEWLLVIRVIQGLGSAGLINLVVVLITDHWSGIERTRLLGQNSAVITTFLAIFPFLGGVTTDLFGWRWNFAYYGMALVVGAVVARSLDDPWEIQRIPLLQRLREAMAELSIPANAMAVGIGSLTFFVMFGVFLTLSPTQRGMVAAVPAVTSTATALVVTWFRVRMSAGVMVAVGLGVFGATFVAMGLGSLWLLVAAAAVYGLAEGITIPTLQDLVAEQAPEHLRGIILALWVSGLRLGQTAGPLVVGVAIGIWSTDVVLVGAGVLVAVVGVAVGTSRVLPDARPSADASL